MDLTTKYDKFLWFIPTGKRNAVLRRHLVTAWGVKDVRQVSRLISQMRKDGVIICADESGIYLPANTQEIEDFYYLMHERSLSLLSALKTTRLELLRRKSVA